MDAYQTRDTTEIVTSNCWECGVMAISCGDN